jgi:hypothetical protein
MFGPLFCVILFGSYIHLYRASSLMGLNKIQLILLLEIFLDLDNISVSRSL